MKFAVGEMAQYIGDAIHGVPLSCLGNHVRILAVGTGTQDVGYINAYKQNFPTEQCYEVDWLDNNYGLLPESYLRKLPGDSIPASTLAIFAKKQPNPDKVKEKA